MTNTSRKFDLLFFKRFFHLLKWMFPSFTSIPVLLFTFLLCLGLLEQYLIYNIGMIPSKFYVVLGKKDQDGFKHQTIWATLWILSEAFVKSTGIYVSSVLYIVWRKSICKSLHKEYFRDVLYYQINVIDKTIDNPDQRITQDVDKLFNTFSKILSKVMISPFTIGYYIYQSATSTGYIGPVSVVGFFLVATVLNKILMSPVVDYVFKQEQMEGNFRFKHMQIRMNAESAAFNRSGAIEKMKTDKCLNQLITAQQRRVRREYALNFTINLFDYLGSILSYLTLAFPIFLGTYDYLSPPDLSALISRNAFVTIYLISCFTSLIDMATQMTEIAGTAHRVGELMETLCRMREEQTLWKLNDDRSSPGPAEVPLTNVTDGSDVRLSSDINPQLDVSTTSDRLAVSVNKVTYGPPKSKDILCNNITFQLKSGLNILVTGESGCGKSSLMRVINGLWKPLTGSIERHISLGPGGILFLPQKPFFTDGSLRQQVIYPLADTELITASVNDDSIKVYLNRVGLSGIVDRVESLDNEVDWNWYDELSPGEMQRLSFVRLFYHQPAFAVLDEATSQIGHEAECLMYSICRELGITVLSVGHRDSLRQFHHMLLNMDGKGGWTFQPIPGCNTQNGKDVGD